MNVIRAALPGFNCLTDINLDHFALYTDEDNVLIKEKQRGTIVQSNGIATITHSMGIIPYVLVFAQVSSGRWAMLVGDSSDYHAHIEIDTTNLYIHNDSLGANITFKYIIFYDSVVSGNPTFSPTGYRLAIAKKGIDVTKATSPNDFIFHSGLNTLKIIKEATATFNFTSSATLQEFTTPHNLSYIPLVMGFVKFNSGTEVMSPNQEWINTVDQNIKFNSVLSDNTNVIFRITNNTGVAGTVYVKYYIFEIPF